MSGLPKGWVDAPFGQVSTKIGSGATPTGGEQSYKASGVPLIRSLNVHFDGVRAEGLAFLDDKQAAKLENVTVEPDDVLLNITGASIGRVAIAPSAYRGARVNQHVSIIRLVRDILPQYVRSFLASPEAQQFIIQENYGATRQALTKTMIEEFIFPLPPLPEQKRIVAKLDALSAKSARARTELARIETLVFRYKQAVFSKAFSGELTREWRNLADWPEPVRLEEVAGSFAYGSAAKSQKVGAVPVLRMGNIQDGQLDWSDLVYTDDATEIAKYRLRSGDVLFNRTNSPALVGKTALYRGDREAIFAGYLIRVVPCPSLMSEYLAYALNSPIGREFSWNVKTDGVSQSNISATKLKEFQFSVPLLAEQHEIVRRIETAFARIDRLAAEAKRALTLLGKLDEAILAKAFRGELVPQDERDEPASVLLDRIRAERAAAPKPKRGRKA